MEKPIITRKKIEQNAIGEIHELFNEYIVEKVNCKTDDLKSTIDTHYTEIKKSSKELENRILKIGKELKDFQEKYLPKIADDTEYRIKENLNSNSSAIIEIIMATAKRISDLQKLTEDLRDSLSTGFSEQGAKLSSIETKISEDIEKANKGLQALHETQFKEFISKLTKLEEEIKGLSKVSEEKNTSCINAINSASEGGIASIDRLDGKLSNSLSTITQTGNNLKDMDAKLLNKIETLEENAKSKFKETNMQIEQFSGKLSTNNEMLTTQFEEKIEEKTNADKKAIFLLYILSGINICLSIGVLLLK